MGIVDFFRRSEPAKKPTVSHPSYSVKSEMVSRSAFSQEETKPKIVSLKVTDTEALEKCLQLENPSQYAEMVFYCPIRNAKIFCHSIMTGLPDPMKLSLIHIIQLYGFLMGLRDKFKIHSERAFLGDIQR